MMGKVKVGLPVRKQCKQINKIYYAKEKMLTKQQNKKIECFAIFLVSLIALKG
jgi:hypothetical protein